MSNTTRPYALLKVAAPGQYGPRDDYRIANTADWWNPHFVVNRIKGPVVVDFETTGLNVLASDFRVVGIGIAGKGLEGGVYFSTKTINATALTSLIKALIERELIAHNVCYDAAVLEVLTRRHLPQSTTLSAKWPWKWDTISMYFHLSQHEWAGQSYGLKAAQVDVLGWDAKGDVELDAWLSERGLGKGDMWQAPDSILGKYGCYDVQSTYQLYEHLLPQLQKFPDAIEFISSVEVPYHYRAIVEMRFHGIKIDTTKLAALKKELEANNEAFRSRFENHEQVKNWIAGIDAIKLGQLIDCEPERLTKTGKVAARWTKWKEKVDNFQEGEWLNTNSKAQLRDLFFGHLYKVSEVRPVMGWDGNQRGFKGGKLLWEVDIFAEGKKIVHEWASKTNDIPISKELLPKLGEIGQMLFDYNADVKLLGYVNGLEDSLVDGVHHGQLRPLGALSGRCVGSGGVNLQQIPKDKRYLDCFIAEEGCSLVDADVTALEPSVLAELSACPSYMKLYGPDAKPNDVYLFVGSNTEALGSKIKSLGYDPNNPTPEAISITKKKLKRERSICKVLHLSSGYGAGPNKIWKTLLSQGVQLELDEAKKIHADYWELFKRVKEYEEELKELRINNGGWIVDGIGIPVTIGKHKLKDILNSVIQGCSHRILVRHIANIMKLRDQEKLDFHFWIADFHDQTTVECLDKDVESVLDLFRRAEKVTNEQLGGLVYLKIEPEAGKCLTPFKL